MTENSLPAPSLGHDDYVREREDHDHRATCVICDGHDHQHNSCPDNQRSADFVERHGMSMPWPALSPRPRRSGGKQDLSALVKTCFRHPYVPLLLGTLGSLLAAIAYVGSALIAQSELSLHWTGTFAASSNSGAYFAYAPAFSTPLLYVSGVCLALFALTRHGEFCRRVGGRMLPRGGRPEVQWFNCLGCACMMIVAVGIFGLASFRLDIDDIYCRLNIDRYQLFR